MGETHQQIYGWRHAINSLDKTGFKTYNLTTSFRFDQKVADLAMKVLEWKQPLNKAPKPVIIGKGSPSKITTKAILARTNLGLLLKAIDYATKKQKIKHIYFEGNINSYTYADEGASLYDVLNLYNGNRVRIKDKLIKDMKDMDELNEYIKKTEDVQLRMMTEIVEKYGNRIPGIIKAIKEKHVKDEEREKAEVIFSTVHRCKGVEYGSIQLVVDFISEKKIEQIMEEHDQSKMDPAKLNEEINLLYVAITRTKNSIHIPESLMPKDFPPSPNIYIIQN